jgi:hypothetical protein
MHYSYNYFGPIQTATKSLKNKQMLLMREWDLKTGLDRRIQIRGGF